MITPEDALTMLRLVMPAHLLQIENSKSRAEAAAAVACIRIALPSIIEGLSNGTVAVAHVSADLTDANIATAAQLQPVDDELAFRRGAEWARDALCVVDRAKPPTT